MKVGERNMYHLQDGKKANVGSSYEILLPWVRGKHPWEVQISAFATKKNCAHYEFQIEFLNVKL
jgi:hypothetical protein